MKDIKLLYQHLTNFLNGESTDRQVVSQWYDQLKNEDNEDQTVIDNIKNKGRIRILNTIQKDRKKIFLRKIYRYTAAAAIIVGGYFVWISYDKGEGTVTDYQLSNVAPAQDRAIIVLEDGTEIDLSKLALNQSVSFGQSIISKDAQDKVSYLRNNSNSDKPLPNILHIPRAATYQLTLVDGTRITLNSDSKLTYPSFFGTGDRVVELEGEAYFEVAHTTHNNRFVVKSKNQSITVLGTKFNVNAYPEHSKIQTSLVEGSVNVRVKDKILVLAPNQQAILEGNKLVAKEVNIDDILGWTRGQFCFDGTNTADVLQEIARWYDIDIDYDQKNKIGKYIGKIPRNLSLDRLIDLLNYAGLHTEVVSTANKGIKIIIQ